MPHEVMEIGYIGLFFILPGVIGGWIAYTKGRNPVLWFLVNGIFPPTLMITLFQGPVRAVRGHYRQCPKCGAYSKWSHSACRFCNTDLSAQQ